MGGATSVMPVVSADSLLDKGIPVSTSTPGDKIREGFADLVGLAPLEARTALPATPYQPPPPLLEATDDELDYAFAANLFDLFRAMGHLPGATVEESQQLSRHLAAPFNPMFKGVWQSRLAEHEADDAIAETIAWFRARQAPFAFWWVDPRATPADLGARLQAHGFLPWEENAPGMAAELVDLRFDMIDQVPRGYTQERVTDERGLHDFKVAFVDGNEVPDWAGQAWVDATLGFGIENAPWRCYVGRLDGRPVACTMLFNGAGVASVFGVATLPAARGKGIGAAITLIAYAEAQRLGYRYGVLFGTESGVPVYRRIGFEEVGATMSRYLWRQ
jgi:GNAT superfamily N-acetyltransferase